MAIAIPAVLPFTTFSVERGGQSALCIHGGETGAACKTKPVCPLWRSGTIAMRKPGHHAIQL